MLTVDVSVAVEGGVGMGDEGGVGMGDEGGVGMGDDGIGGDDVGSSAKGVGRNLDRDWAAALDASDDNFLNLNFDVLVLED